MGAAKTSSTPSEVRTILGAARNRRLPDMLNRNAHSLRSPMALVLAALGVLAVSAPGEADAAKYTIEAGTGPTSLSGISGFSGNESKSTTDLTYFKGQVAIGERADVPAFFSGGGYNTRVEFSTATATDWKEARIDGAITGIQICTNGPANDTDKHRIKGVRIWGKSKNPVTGKLEGAVEDSFERTNCPKDGWRPRKDCPAGQAAVGFKVHAGDNGAITGIGLVCATPAPKLYLEKDESCTLDGTPCGDFLYCRFLPTQNCGKSLTTGAKAGLKPAGVCTRKEDAFGDCVKALPEAEKTLKVCGCDGKVYDNICSLRFVGISRQPIEACGPDWAKK